MRSRFLIGFVCSLALALGSLAEEAVAPMFPFVMPWDDATPGVTSMAMLNDAPAGEHGHVFAADGHLWRPDASVSAGRTRIRFMGVNLAFAANFPSHAEAGKIAARLAKLGVNCVRFHHMDRDAAPRGLWQTDLKTLDAGQLDRLDYFISRLKAHGIYANINLHVSRVYPDQPTWSGMPPFHKGVDLYMPQMISLQKEFARALLLHVNPYTGRSYASDPAVAFVEINNENGLVSRWWEKSLDDMPEYYAAELARQWRRWRRAHGLDSGGDAIVLRKDFEAQNESQRAEWVRFLWETERDYWRQMQNFLQRDLGVRALVIGTQLYSYSAVPLQADLDVIDIHAYWAHPEFPDKADRSRWTVVNESMVNHPEARTLSDLALQRVAGKPLIITEYNHSSPNTYSAEAFPMVAAYAAMHDWDGIFVYSYAHGNQPLDAGRITGNFDIYTHAPKLATLPVAAAMFRRGDVAAALTGTEWGATEEEFLRLTTRYGVNIGGQHLGASRYDALRRPQVLRIGAPAQAFTTPPRRTYGGAIVSDTGELRWDARPKRGVFTVDTPRTKSVIGFTDGERIELGALTLLPGQTRQGWSTIAITQMEGARIGAAGRALLVACGDIENEGQIWKSAAHDSVTNWGKGPTLVEGIPVQVELATDLPVRVWALDECGRRRTEVSVQLENGKAQFSIGPAYRTIWYEVSVGEAR